MWRLPDSCHEPRGVSAGEGRHVAAPRVLRIGAGPLQMARAALRIRARQNADRHPGRLACAAAADREPGPARGDCCELARGRRRIRRDQAALPAVLDMIRSEAPRASKMSSLGEAAMSAPRLALSCAAIVALLFGSAPAFAQDA